MRWVKTPDGRQDSHCDRCGAHSSAELPFSGWASVLFPGAENAKHFCSSCVPVLRVVLDEAMAKQTLERNKLTASALRPAFAGQKKR